MSDDGDGWLSGSVNQPAGDDDALPSTFRPNFHL
jgi:hypothetical protein